jgi:hypothetical protein
MNIEPTFVKEKSEYKRTYYPIPHYIEQMAYYLSRKRGIPYEKALEYIKFKFKNGEIKPSDRSAVILAKDENGDRYKTEVRLIDYFRVIKHKQLRVAPTFTTYVSPKEKESLYGGYIREKAKLRKGFKKLQFKFEMAGDKVNESFYNSLQNSCKIKINSLSGTHSSPGTISYLASGHSTLTSTCRVITSTSNAMNEKFIMGNRHYYSPMITLCNIIAIGEDAKNHEIAETIQEYGLVYPTVKDAMELIRKSASHYWLNEDAFSHLESLLKVMTKEELAFFVYGADLYHLEKHNPEFIKKFILDHNVISEKPIENPSAALESVENEDLEILALLNCAETAGGIQMADIAKKHPELHNRIASTAVELVGVQNKYAKFIRAFLRPNLLPHSFYDIASMVRYAVPLSDTDSTVYTNQKYAIQYFPNNPFTHEANCVNYTMTYFITQLLRHNIAMLSVNLGLENELIGQISMKNEYCFPVLFLTELVKHYFALKSAQEGNILPTMKDETKGVNLRNSAASADLNARLYNLMRESAMKIYGNEKIELLELHHFVACIEKEVYEDIRNGGSQYLRSIQTKEEDSYSQKEDAPAVKQHRLWEEVFAPKYGSAPDLPYRSVSIKLSTNGKSRTAEWIASIEDRDLAQRLERWLENNGKKDITSLRLPVDVIANVGVPREILSVAKIREVVKMIVNPFYIFLTTFNITVPNDKVSYLFSDDYFKLEEIEDEEAVSEEEYA